MVALFLYIKKGTQMKNEIVIGGVSYTLRFGLGFLREINKRVQMPLDGAPTIKNNIGLKYTVGRMMDGSVEDLIDIIYLANKNENPRLTMATIDEWIEDPETDIDEVFDEVMDFLRTANATRKEVAALEEAAAEQRIETKNE